MNKLEIKKKTYSEATIGDDFEVELRTEGKTLDIYFPAWRRGVVLDHQELLNFREFIEKTINTSNDE